MILLLLFTKHFMVDFLLQTEYQWKNKGILFHPGGILHSALHGISSFAILIYFSNMNTALILSMLDFVIHYVVDFSKVRINTKLELSYNNPKFWYLLGFDQYLHALTYLLIYQLCL